MIKMFREREMTRILLFKKHFLSETSKRAGDANLRFVSYVATAESVPQFT